MSFTDKVYTFWKISRYTRMRLMYHQNQIALYDDGRDMSERKDFFSDGSLDCKGHSVFVTGVTMN